MATIQTSIKLNDHFSAALNSMNKALNMAINSFESMHKVSGKAIDTSSLQAARSELARVNVQMQNVESSIHDANNAQNNLNKSIQNGESAAGGLWDKIKGIAAAYLTFQGVQNLVAAGDAYSGNVARLDIMNDGLQTTAELQQKIYEASQRALTSYGDMTNAVSKLGITAGHAFKNNDEMIAFAELMNKQFAIAGTGTQEKSAAMYQLTQAMASGRLQGDEFRSILENAPMLAQTIAEYMGMTLGELREVSSEGKITADVIKNALFSAADETNKKFANMPMTWADLWVQMTNKASKGLEPLYIKLRELWNNKNVQLFLDGLVNGFLVIGQVGLHAFEMISGAVAVLYNNWSLLEPIVWGLVAALGVYFAIQTAGLIRSIAQWVAATAVVVGHQIALFAATWAQWGLNAALAACPLSWIIYGIIAIIALFYLAVAGINKFAGTSLSATGMIAGAFSWLGALIFNIFAGIYNIASGVVQALVNSFLWLSDNLGIIFDNIGIFWGNLWQSAKIMFYEFVDSVISGIQTLAGPLSALAKMFDMDVAGVFDNMSSGLNTKIQEAEGQKKQYGKVKPFQAIEWESAQYKSLGKAYEKGYDWGANLSLKDVTSGITEALGFDSEMATSGLGGAGLGGPIGTAMKNANMPMLDKLDEIAGNTAATNDTISKNNEDMSYLRDLAEREAINRMTTNNTSVNMTNNNKIDSSLDLDNFVDYLKNKIYDTMQTSGEGVHY